MSLRLFVALELPAAGRAELAAWADGTAWADGAAPAALRRVPAADLHVTLAFLGQRSEAQALAVGERLGQLARPLGALRSAGALWLPPRRPGVLAVALAGSEGLSALHGDLVEALSEAIGLEPERRPFLPHVTVARVRSRGGVRPAPLAPAPVLDMVPEALTLYRSHTGTGGARYERRASVGLA